MVKQLIEGDRLFFIAESLAKDFSLFPQVAQEDQPVPGLLSSRDISRRQEELRELNIDAYIEAVVAPAEDQSRIAAPAIIRQLGRVLEEQSSGPYYQASVLMNFGDGIEREVGFVAQDRTVELGSWMPEHHLRAADFIDRCSSRAMPIVSFMDTPGQIRVKKRTSIIRRTVFPV